MTAVATELVRVPQRGGLAMLRPIAEPAEILKVQNETRAFVKEALTEGRDYGVIPGTGDKKTMLKPGAERTAIAFGCYYGEPVIIEQEADHDRSVPWRKVKNKYDWKGGKRGRKIGEEVSEGVSLGLYRYVVKVPLIHAESGRTIAVGVGVCSTMESKYVDRPRDSENTVLKMAHKRALVAACLLGFGLSDEFTQDVEDLDRSMDEEETGHAPAQTSGEAKPAARKEKPAREKRMPMGHNKGKLLGEMETKDLESAAKWCRENNKYPDLVSAIADVLAERQKDQGKLELDARAPANPPAAGGAASPSATEGASPASSASAEKALPANRARWSSAQLQAHLLALLNAHPDLALEEPMPQTIKEINAGSLTHGNLVQNVVLLEAMLEKKAKAPRVKAGVGAVSDEEYINNNEDDDLPF